jgi:hypothetical protein
MFKPPLREAAAAARAELARNDRLIRALFGEPFCTS